MLLRNQLYHGHLKEINIGNEQPLRLQTPYTSVDVLGRNISRRLKPQTDHKFAGHRRGYVFTCQLNMASISVP